MTPARSDRLGIGAVLARLQEEFPDVSLSKIRFLEAEGLINPERTASGYRKLAAQRDRFWPLKVIRDALDAMDRGLPVDADTATSRPSVPAASLDPELPGPASLAGGDGPRLTSAEVAAAASASERLVSELTDFGLLRPDHDGLYPGESSRIAAAAAQLAAFGIEARHLRPFRVAADREVGLIDYAAASATRPEPADVAHAALALHTALVKDALHRRD